MSIVLNDNIKINAGKPSESKYFNTSGSPYTGTTQVVSQVNISERHIGLTVNVNQVEYWFKDGVTNGDLIIKQSGSVTGATNGLNINNNNIRLGGVITGTTSVSLGVGTGYTRVDFNHTDNNIAIEYNTDIDYDLPFNGAKIGVDSDGIFVAQNNYQTPQRGSVPYIRDDNGHIAFQGLEENQVYSVDASGNPIAIGLGNLDPWLTGGTFISQGNISIQGGDALEYSFEHNVDSFNVQAINNIGLQSGNLLNIQSNTINVLSDEKIILNANIYNAGIIIGAISGDTNGIQLQLGDSVTAPLTGALFYQNEFGVLDSINPTSDGDVLTVVGGLPTWSSGIGIITGATNGLSVDTGNVILGGDFTSANLNNLAGDAVFQINIGEETVTNKHSLYFDTTQFYLQSIGTSGNTRNYNLSENFTADGFEQLIFVSKDDVQISNPSGYFTLNDGLTIAATDNLADVITSFNLTETGITLTDNRSIKKGIEYADDYSAGFTLRSIPDVAWVLSQVSSGGTGGGTVTGATNGLNIDNNNVRLGGNLSGYTQLQLDGDYTTFQLYSPMGVTGVTKFGTYFSDGFQSSTGIQQANDNITISVNSNTIAATLKLDGISGITIGGGAMRYVSDYSSGYTALSIPSVGWVTGLTSGGSVNVGNGLSKSGSTIVLGGSLTGNTIISTNENEFVIGDPFGTGNYLGLNFLDYGFVVENQTNPQGITIGNYTGITSINHNDPNEIFDISSTTLLRIHTSNNGLTPVQGIEISAADNGFLYLESIDGSNSTNLRISVTGDTIFTDYRNVGFKYGGDYSANYTALSIPNVGWITGSSITNGDNGLTKNGSTVVLGGVLNQDTEINGSNSNSLNLNNLSTFQIGSTDNTGQSGIISGDADAGDTYKLSLISDNTNNITSIKISSSLGVLVSDGSNNGIKYDNDYSANFTSRSLIDQEYALGLVQTEVSLSSSSGEITPTKLNYIGLYDTSTTAITVDLPTTPINKSVLKIKDRTGNAGSKNITINGNGRTIDGLSSALINTNYGCIELLYNDSTDEWFIIGMVI